MSDSDQNEEWEPDELEAVVERIADSEDRSREDVLYRMLSSYWVLDELEDVMEPPRDDDGHGGSTAEASSPLGGPPGDQSPTEETGEDEETTEQTSQSGRELETASGESDLHRTVGAVREIVADLVRGGVGAGRADVHPEDTPADGERRPTDAGAEGAGRVATGTDRERRSRRSVDAPSAEGTRRRGDNATAHDLGEERRPEAEKTRRETEETRRETEETRHETGRTRREDEESRREGEETQRELDRMREEVDRLARRYEAHVDRSGSSDTIPSWLAAYTANTPVGSSLPRGGAAAGQQPRQPPAGESVPPEASAFQWGQSAGNPSTQPGRPPDGAARQSTAGGGDGTRDGSTSAEAADARGGSSDNARAARGNSARAASGDNAGATAGDSGRTAESDDTTTAEGDTLTERVAALLDVSGDVSSLEERQKRLVERLEEESDNTAEVLAYLLERTDDHEEWLTALEDTVESRFADRLTTLMAQVETVESELDEVTADVTETESELSAVRGEVTDVSSTVTDVESSVEEVEGEVGALRARQRDFRAYVDEEHEYVAEVLRYLVDHTEAVEDRLQTVEDSVEEYDERLTDHREQLAEYEERLADHEEQLAQLRERQERREERREQLTAITREADAAGVRAAECEACSESVDLTLLHEPECPHCGVEATGVDEPEGWFGDATLRTVRSEAPHGNQPRGSDRPPQGPDRASSTNDRPPQASDRASSTNDRSPQASDRTSRTSDRHAAGEDNRGSETESSDSRPVWYDESELSGSERR
jgi:peptidoglycan hydrolase CwlO-like protein